MDKGRTCGVISFELTGGRDAAVRFMVGLKLANIATHVAASKTMVLHPASHTHRQMNDEQLREAGVSNPRFNKKQFSGDGMEPRSRISCVVAFVI